MTSEISLTVKPVPASDVVALMEMAHEIVLGALLERTMPGLVISSIPVRVIPDATIWVEIPPEYTIPLKESCPSVHHPLLKLRSTDPEDSHPLAERYDPVAALPELFVAVTRTVSFGSSVPLRLKCI